MTVPVGSGSSAVFSATIGAGCDAVTPLIAASARGVLFSGVDAASLPSSAVGNATIR